MAHRILMLKRSAQNIGDDFHVMMRMRAEAAAGRHCVVVDDAQTAKTHPVRIVIVREGKRVPGVQPAMIGMATLFGFSDLDHNE
jgi:hypothetical protein